MSNFLSGTGRWAGRLLLVISLCVNVIQGIHILRVEDELTHPPQSGLDAGTLMPPFSATDISGQHKRVEFESNALPTLLYVFSPTCSWCERNSPWVLSLQSQSAGKFRMLGLSLSSNGLREFVRSHAITFPVYSDIPQGTISAYRLGPTPETILVSSSGRLARVWMGAYGESSRASIEQALAIRFPLAKQD